MKTILVLIGFSLFAASTFAQQSAPVFIKATVEYQWENGASTSPNIVDIVLSETNDGYVISSPAGKHYLLPKACAEKISAAEAAILLLTERNQKAAQIAALTNQLQSGQPAAPQLYRKPASGHRQTPEEANRWWQAEQQRDELQRQTRELQNLRRDLQR